MRPLFLVDREKADLGEQGAPVFGRGTLSRFGWPYHPGDIVEQALDERAELTVGGRPIAARVGLDCLGQVAKRRIEPAKGQKLTNLVFGFGKLDLLR